jgi:hypothetical protein
MKFIGAIVLFLSVFASCQKHELIPAASSVEVPEVLNSSTTNNDDSGFTGGVTGDDTTTDPSITDPNNENSNPKRKKVIQN